ncbi:Pr6Pr family membrane protein [Microbacterium sp.]|uniref:Pr6Pr family membrane protein n=1 Tax=Microbacterium sp. TaxID=51671 RepID=UPI002810F01D|nr:Pr6Pr family membrane protein [Microbacterium sp.]
MTTWWPIARLVAAALILAAILAQLQRTLEIALRAETPWASHLPTVITNFFSFFTILSNLSAVLALFIAVVWAWTAGRDAVAEPRWLAMLLVCASTYMIITGVVYNTLLRGIELPQGQTVPWSNEVLHLIGPLFLLLDVLVAPRRRALPWATVLAAAVFPIVWAVYTLVRANMIVSPGTGNPYWYPYPFLDPHQPGGYAIVAVYVVGIAAVIIGVSAAVVWAGRRRAQRVGDVDEPLALVDRE